MRKDEGKQEGYRKLAEWRRGGKGGDRMDEWVEGRREEGDKRLYDEMTGRNRMSSC